MNFAVVRKKRRDICIYVYRGKYGTDRILSLIVFSYTVYVYTYILRTHIPCAYFRQCSMILTYYIPHAYHTRDTQAYMVNTIYHTMKSSIRCVRKQKDTYVYVLVSTYIYIYTNFYITYSPAMLVSFVIHTHTHARARIFNAIFNSYEVANILRIYFSCDFIEYGNHHFIEKKKKKSARKRNSYVHQ